MPSPLYTSLDEALDAICACGIELKNGNSNHAPMVAEALCAMGRPEAVMPWIARYRDRMSPRPPTGDRIGEDCWRGALGRRERFSDWSLFFAEALQNAPWTQVLDEWVARLAPGFCAAATHGVIRLGHGVRGLAADKTPQRFRELADALAAWATAYRELPTADFPASRALAPRRAIATVPLLPAGQRLAGNIETSLRALTEFPEFAPTIGILDTSGEIGRLVAELSEVFARIYLANACSIPTAIAFIHGVTSHAALGNIAPHIADATARIALRFAWQTGCGLYACYGGARTMAEGVEPLQIAEDELIDRAIANGDEHVIKFTEACLIRNALGPSPAYYAAIEHAEGILGRR